MTDDQAAGCEGRERWNAAIDWLHRQRLEELERQRLWRLAHPPRPVPRVPVPTRVICQMSKF
jgi:hypothetical protein